MEEGTFEIWETAEVVTDADGQMQLIDVQNSHINQQAEIMEEEVVEEEATYVNENDIETLDQIPPENLIYMAAEDGSFIEGEVVHIQDDVQEEVVVQEQIIHHDGEFMECEVTEEVITDDWVQPQGEECVQVTVEQLIGPSAEAEDDLNVPLPTDQDEYTTSRPYPCDFCSRRFRKKANLMNHMVAHSNDRPHVCNLCGARYIRRCDLLNHLKIHAYAIDDHDDDALIDDDYDIPPSPRKGAKRLPHDEEDLLLRMDKKTPTPKKRYKSTSKTSSHKPPARKPAATKRKNNENDYVNVDDEFRNSSTNNEKSPRYPVTDERKPFVCQHCGVSFAREKALASHARIHGGDSPFECDTCGELFWDIGMLQEHIRQRHADQPDSNSEYEPVAENDSEENEDYFDKDFYCDSCGISFHRKELLKRHIKQLHGVKTDAGFDEIFQKEDEDLNEDDDDEEDHRYNTQNQAPKPLCCNVCGDTFAEALDLLAHAEVHARYECHKCQLCGETFLDEPSIKSHLRDLHSREMSDTSCALCGKPCRNHSALMKHAWEHSRERSHSCSKCGKTFHNKARLKRHMVSHRNKSVKCEVCGDEFPDGRSLMNHRHSHTKSSQFPCTECGKSFGSRSSQQIHIRIHTGERPYGCRYCWKAFADGGTLRKHERIHTGEKPYGCSVCPRAFNQRVVLREHIRSHHSAPDTKRGTNMKPYYCQVCSQLFETSLELIQHLIQHSDLNTAMKRQPPTGPRKYKRRRKLKPHELERLQQINQLKNDSDDLDYSDDDNHHQNNDDDDDELLKSSTDLLHGYGEGSGSSRKAKQSSPKYDFDLLPQKSTTSFNDTGISLLSNVVSINNNNKKANRAAALVEDSPKKRAKQILSTFPSLSNSGASTSRGGPKMIHTSKTRVQISDGKRKTKTMITKEVKQEVFRSRSTKNYEFISSDKIPPTVPLLDDGNDHEQNSQDIDVVTVPSTSHSRGAVKHGTNFDELLNQNLLMEISKKDKYIDKYNSDIVNDLEEILRSPIKNINNSAPPAVIMATPPNYSSNNNYDDDFTVENVYKKTPHAQRPPVQKKLSSSSKKASEQKELSRQEQRILTANLRSARLSRRQQQQQEMFEARQIQQLLERADEEIRQHVKQEPPEEQQGKTLEDEGPTDPLALDETDEKEFKCEMCSASFDDRTKLLLHVPIHI